MLACVPRAQMIDTFGHGASATSPLGDAVAIRVGGIEIVVNQHRTQALGDVFTPLGVDWRSKKVVIVKSSQHFYAAYAPSADQVLYAETPGSMTMDWSKLPYRKRPAGLWPFEM